MMNEKFNPRYPSVMHLKAKAKKRIPSFSFDYLEGGSSDERALKVSMMIWQPSASSNILSVP